jgi:hypothetical protein
MGFSPLIYAFKNLYRAMARAALTDVKISSARDRSIRCGRDRGGADHVMLPGMKQRIEVPRVPLTGQTIVLPARFGSVITASSGTSIHSLSTRTR